MYVQTKPKCIFDAAVRSLQAIPKFPQGPNSFHHNAELVSNGTSAEQKNIMNHWRRNFMGMCCDVVMCHYWRDHLNLWVRSTFVVFTFLMLGGRCTWGWLIFLWSTWKVLIEDLWTTPVIWTTCHGTNWWSIWGHGPWTCFERCCAVVLCSSYPSGVTQHTCHENFPHVDMMPCQGT